MTDEAQPGGGRKDDGADASPFVDEDFGGIASGGDWRDHVEPYASREDPLPEHGNAWRDSIDTFATAPGVRADAEEVPGADEPVEEAAPPGMAVDDRSGDTSDFTDAEEEGWPSRDDD